MAMLTGHTSVNLIDIECERTYKILLGFYVDSGGSVIKVEDERTEHCFDYVGMTKAAAKTCVTAMYAAYASGTVNAVAVARGDGGYNVNVTVSTSTIIQTAI